ncbi:hypothetical protein, partial [Priestia megaterium]|uniref:hypothetical protein n=1 Tax=Priestia megaterium TaxID=1404 RepID=UPI0033924CDF
LAPHFVSQGHEFFVQILQDFEAAVFHRILHAVVRKGDSIVELKKVGAEMDACLYKKERHSLSILLIV